MLVIGGVLIGAISRGCSCLGAQTFPDGFGNAIRREPASGTTVEPESKSDSHLARRHVELSIARMAGCYLRSMSDLEPRELPGTGLAISPEFSPDGRSIVFWGDSMLKRLLVDTPGTAITICGSRCGALEHLLE